MLMVFVISSDGTPLDPCHEARARELLKKGRAAVWRMFPLTIKLKDRTRAESVVATHCLKLDPGSKTTGIAVVQEGTGRVVFAAELTHRGQAIRDPLLARSFRQPAQAQRLARAKPAAPGSHDRKLGQSAPALLPGYGTLCRTGEVRHAAHAEPRNQRGRVSARGVARLGGTRLFA